MMPSTVARALALALGLTAPLTITACAKDDAPASAQPSTPAPKAPKAPKAPAANDAPKAPAANDAADETSGALELTLSGDLFGDGKVVTVPFSASMTGPAMAGHFHRLNGQGPIEVPGHGTVTLDFALFIPKGKEMAPGTFDGGVFTDPEVQVEKSLVTFALGVGSGETFHRAYRSQSGTFTITEVGPRMRGQVTGTFDVKTTSSEDEAELSIKGSFAIRHVM